ncbi:MAG: hypothetical protein ABSH02_14150 [Candidatus Sulfotelmatobacter sp.]
MHAARDVTISNSAASARGPLLVRGGGRKGAAKIGIFLLYILLLGGVAIRLYRLPIYSMDSIQYMGNALLMEEHDPVRIHERVYGEVRRFVPKVEKEGLLGHEVGAPEDQNKSRQERAANPERFAEFLPLFAIRPLYNQTLWLMSKTGMGLVRAGIFLSVTSYFFLGVLAFVWVGKYMNPWFTLGVSILLMISPPLMTLGRDTTADPLATLVAFGSLYLIFEKRQLLPGMILLLASIYFRTDFVVLAGPVLLACWLERRIELWKAGVLALVAVASVLCINHFAGDYGMGMLYYRNFAGVPIAPGEMTVQFSARNYFTVLRSGITLMMASFFLPFLLLGTIGTVSRRMRGLFAVTLAYLLLHFMILPNWQERWFGVFYLSMAVCAAAAVGEVQRDVAIDATE